LIKAIKRILSQFVDLNEIEQKDLNFKSQLIEWSQKSKRDLEFETTEEINEKTKQPKFTAVVIVDNQRIGQGSGTSKKEAQQNAAHEALEKIENLDFEELQNN
jgi:ribonuclease-3